MELFEEGFWEQFKDKKVVLYGAAGVGRNFLYWAEKAGIEVAYFVDRKAGRLMMDIEVKDPAELLNENFERIKIVITSFKGMDPIINTLTEMGFSCDKQIVTITEYINKLALIKFYQVDALLGLSRGDKIAYNYREKNSDDEIVIVTVGDSTTDPAYMGINSWPFYLQEIIDNNKIVARVVNIAHARYTSSQALLLLLRDGLDISPNIVISYVGITDNNTELDIDNCMRYSYTSTDTYLAFKELLENYSGDKPFGDVYYGKPESDRFERYITNMRLMHAMCAEFNCKFYGLLQPSLPNIPRELLQSSFAKRLSREPDVIAVADRWRNFYNEYLQLHKTYDYLYDFSHILNGHDDVFYDRSHVTEDGNKIIAENVFKLLMETKAFEK